MLNSEIFDTMMGRLGSRVAANMRATCVRELNLGIRELERAPTKPWFLETTATGVLVASQDYLALPANFLIETEQGTLELQNEDGEWIEIPKDSREKIREARNDDPAFPEGYAIWGNRFYFAAAPDQAYNYRFDYYARSSAIADNGSEVTNEWILEFFDYVTYRTLIVVSRDWIKDRELAAGYVQSFTRAEDYFTRECTARQVANETHLLTDEET